MAAKKVLFLDVETTISNKGNPFDRNNKCVMVGTLTDFSHPITRTISKQTVEELQYQIDSCNLLVGFNIKFDLHWLRNIGIDISKVKVWDCQLAEFILNNQETKYPSLDEAAEKYGFKKKLDIVKLEYWDRGIDTDKIPEDVLSAYLSQDLLLTQQVYKKQLELFDTDNRYALFRLHCADLLVLEEMEYNGIKFNTEKAMVYANKLDENIKNINGELGVILQGIPFNPNSNDHVSSILYGGNIVEVCRIPVGVYKTGEKVGQVRYKLVDKVYELPRLVEPIKGTEVKDKEGYWQVNEKVLKRLKLTKTAKRIVDLLNEYSTIEKLKGTYLEGYTDLIEKMNWEKDTIHGNLNQCVVITGRLSSTKPNLQNADPTTKIFMETRY